jgi:hypothetical protein
MNQLCIHPRIYNTGEDLGLLKLLERTWVREHRPGNGTFFLISGFGNFNGGVRFYDVFEKHVAAGGRVRALFSASSSSRLTSRQVIEALLGRGVEVTLVNRKRLMHAKMYGREAPGDRSAIVTSGNFTGPGMSQNVEASVLLGGPTLEEMGFSWETLFTQLCSQSWLYYTPRLDALEEPAWKLLYDEREIEPTLVEEEETTLLVTLSHSDTARIQAKPGTAAGKGTQYFWLSRDSFDFFPPLTIRNERGQKTTYSCLVTLRYVDLDVVDESRVTFEAENNLDFRLGTGRLRYTGIASEGDIAAITRVKETEYELRIFQKGAKEFQALDPYATTFIGHQGKRFGYMTNAELANVLGIPIGGARPQLRRQPVTGGL